MAASQVEIVNLALQKCGETRISSMSQDTKAAREATSAWDTVRRATLRLNYWNFAKGRAELAPSATAPLMGWTYQFPVPADFLALRGIFQDNTYQQQYTDITYAYVTENTATQRVIMAEINPLFITYTKDVTDTAQFDPLFDQVLACQMAQQLVYPLSLSIDRLSSIQKECEYWTRKAKLVNAIENKPEVYKSSEWVDARFEGDTFLRRGPVA
jgi:hypothetical protein